MAKFRKKKLEAQFELNTASMPDIIFMLLFFFMVTTTMREVSLFVKLKAPEAYEIQKLQKASPVSYIYVGKPTQPALFGTDDRFQCNDQFKDIDEIAGWAIQERQILPEEQKNKMTVALKVNEETRMGLVTDIKQELRKAQAYKINYTTRRKGK
ncbi:MAG TPA: biopolymer transporter ExbD [Bacteroidales bacterium]|nr:biopolymer transporter ExbD [Bacteroidales bacterium]HRZ49212.1 biopolymer transporter ExbD [Bacteroidales bacterium]